MSTSRHPPVNSYEIKNQALLLQACREQCASEQHLQSHLKSHLKRAGYKCPVFECRCLVESKRELLLHLEVVHRLQVRVHPKGGGVGVLFNSMCKHNSTLRIDFAAKFAAKRRVIASLQTAP